MGLPEGHVLFSFLRPWLAAVYFEVFRWTFLQAGWSPLGSRKSSSLISPPWVLLSPPAPSSPPPSLSPLPPSTLPLQRSYAEEQGQSEAPLFTRPHSRFRHHSPATIDLSGNCWINVPPPPFTTESPRLFPLSFVPCRCHPLGVCGKGVDFLGRGNFRYFFSC